MNKTADDFAIGPRLRRLRIGLGLSQRELARRAGVSNATISMIEADRVSPSVSALRQVLSALDVGVAEFFADPEAPAEKVVFRANELTEIAGGAVSYRQVGANLKGRALQMIHERYKPGAQSGAKMLSHQGEEAGLVIKGRLGLEVDGRRYELSPATPMSSTAASRTRSATSAAMNSSSFRPAPRRPSSDVGLTPLALREARVRLNGILVAVR